MLELHNVTKCFGDRRALDDVTITLAPGALTGFVGSNGAGKTTTMRIIMGLLEPDSGYVTWDGSPLTTEQRRTFGYMPEERGLYPKQPVREQLIYFGRLHSMTSAQAARRADHLLETFDLADRGTTRIEQLSLGNQQRVQIAVALMHHPEALILDEPFSGLDPEAVDAMGILVRTCAESGVPVLFSSHQLDLVERLCDQIVVISAGKVVAAGTAEKLRAGRDPVIRLDAPNIGDRLQGAEGIEVKKVTTGSVLFTPKQAGAGEALLRRTLMQSEVSHFGEVILPLSEIYKEMVS